MQAFRYQAIYIIATTDLKVPRSYFVKNGNNIGFHDIKSVQGPKYITLKPFIS